MAQRQRHDEDRTTPAGSGRQQGRYYGPLILVKNMNGQAAGHFMLTRIEHLRRSLILALGKFIPDPFLRYPSPAFCAYSGHDI